MKYQKKPIIIEAYQTFEEKIIHTLEGDMKASVITLLSIKNVY